MVTLVHYECQAENINLSFALRLFLNWKQLYKITLVLTILLHTFVTWVRNNKIYLQ